MQISLYGIKKELVFRFFLYFNLVIKYVMVYGNGYERKVCPCWAHYKNKAVPKDSLY